MVVLQNATPNSLSAAMNARIVGSGTRPMVLAHGFGTDQSVWDKTLPVLSQHFKILVFDWLFSGAVKDQTLYDPVKYGSYDAFADDLIKLMEEMAFDETPVLFVGHSMAGMIGCSASVKRPELFERLFLVGASPRYINADGYNGGFEPKDIDVIFASIESNYETWSTQFPNVVVDPKDSDSVQRIQRCLKRMKPETALPLAKTVFGSDERHVLGKVSVPCTIVQSENDAVAPGHVATYMRENIGAAGNSTVEIVWGAQGHFPQMTSHVAFLDVMRRVLEF